MCNVVFYIIILHFAQGLLSSYSLCALARQRVQYQTNTTRLMEGKKKKEKEKKKRRERERGGERDNKI
jgi:hypothetical protein